MAAAEADAIRERSAGMGVVEEIEQGKLARCFPARFDRAGKQTSIAR